MHKRKTFKCSVCGAEVLDLPMPVLKHRCRTPSLGPMRLIGGSEADSDISYCRKSSERGR
jgi:hypothetical protein